MCPKCHCCDSSVYKTLRVTRYRIRRYRTCRHCSHNFSTTEEANKTKNTGKEEDIYIVDDDFDS